jgi:hypothetical protein
MVHTHTNTSSLPVVRVKGREFSVASLLDHDQQLIELFGDKPSLAIFRLAPQVLSLSNLMIRILQSFDI